jgi:hypothetical protein
MEIEEREKMKSPLLCSQCNYFYRDEEHFNQHITLCKEDFKMKNTFNRLVEKNL